MSSISAAQARLSEKASPVAMISPLRALSLNRRLPRLVAVDFEARVRHDGYVVDREVGEIGSGGTAADASRSFRAPGEGFIDLPGGDGAPVICLEREPEAGRDRPYPERSHNVFLSLIFAFLIIKQPGAFVKSQKRRICVNKFRFLWRYSADTVHFFETIIVPRGFLFDFFRLFYLIYPLTFRSGLFIMESDTESMTFPVKKYPKGRI